MSQPKAQTNAGDSASEVNLARLRLARAQAAVQTAKDQSRLAKRRRKEAKEAARRAKKLLKQAKAALAEAQQAVTEAEAKVVAPRRKTLTGKGSAAKVVARKAQARRKSTEGPPERAGNDERPSAPAAPSPAPLPASSSNALTKPMSSEKIAGIKPPGEDSSNPNAST